MRLPNAEAAQIDIRKLRDYALNFEDPRGRHKALVFRSALGYTADDAEKLHDRLLKAILEADCALGELDFYGQRYTVDCKIKNEVGEATVRTAWIIRRNEDFPRLTTCFVLKEAKKLDETKN